MSEHDKERPRYYEASANLFNPSFIGIGYIQMLRNEAARFRSYPAAQREAQLAALAATRPQLPGVIAYLSDNGPDADLAKTQIDLSLAGIEQDLRTLTGESRFQKISRDIPAQDSIAAAYDLWAAHTDRNCGGYPTVIFVNCAPRRAEAGRADNNQGEQVFIGVAADGTILTGTGAHCFSAYREAIAAGEIEFFRVRVQTFDSQFRSRDFFPPYATVLAHNLQDRHAALFADLHQPPDLAQRRRVLGDLNFVDFDTILRAECVPPLEKDGLPIVTRRDVHNNIKTAIRWSDLVAPEGAPMDDPRLRYGEWVAVTINGVTQKAKVVRSMFELQSGELGLSAGSNGRDPAHPAVAASATAQIYIMHGEAAPVFGLSDAVIRQGVSVDIRRDEGAVRPSVPAPKSQGVGPLAMPA